MGFRPATNSCALFSDSLPTGSSRPNSGSASVEKRTISNRSSSPRFARQNDSARRACSSFCDAIEPEVSSTKQMSLGCTAVFSAVKPGEIIRRNVP